MKAEDLMVGDWARNDLGEAQRVVELREKGAMLSYNDIYQYDDIQPIPLTKEILEKNGFGKFDFPNIEKQHKWYLPLDTLSYISLWTRELNDNSSNGWMCHIEKQPAVSGCFMIVNIHDLQHLIKLAGIEKEIQI